MPNLLVPAVIAVGGLTVVSIAIFIGRRGMQREQFKRITSLPVPPRSARLPHYNPPGPTTVPPAPRPTRSAYLASLDPVRRAAESDLSLPTYTASQLQPPPPVYNPSAPRSHRTHRSQRSNVTLTPNSMASPVDPTEQITFPVSRPASITPFVPSPAPSIRPPSYRSGRSASSTRLPRVSSLVRDGGLAEAGVLPPRYDLVAAR